MLKFRWNIPKLSKKLPLKISNPPSSKPVNSSKMLWMLLQPLLLLMSTLKMLNRQWSKKRLPPNPLKLKPLNLSSRMSMSVRRLLKLNLFQIYWASNRANLLSFEMLKSSTMLRSTRSLPLLKLLKSSKTFRWPKISTSKRFPLNLPPLKLLSLNLRLLNLLSLNLNQSLLRLLLLNLNQSLLSLLFLNLNQSLLSLLLLNLKLPNPSLPSLKKLLSLLPRSLKRLLDLLPQSLKKLLSLLPQSLKKLLSPLPQSLKRLPSLLPQSLKRLPSLLPRDPKKLLKPLPRSLNQQLLNLLLKWWFQSQLSLNLLL